jgi:hypothetical protein
MNQDEHKLNLFPWDPFQLLSTSWNHRSV